MLFRSRKWRSSEVRKERSDRMEGELEAKGLMCGSCCRMKPVLWLSWLLILYPTAAFPNPGPGGPLPCMFEMFPSSITPG